jgi:hypothetical protein
LVSLQVRCGKRPDPREVRAAILEGADACSPLEVDDCRPYMTGILNATKAARKLREIVVDQIRQPEAQTVEPSGCSCGGDAQQTPPNGVVHSQEGDATVSERYDRKLQPAAPAVAASRQDSQGIAVLPSAEPAVKQRLVFAIGLVGFDFGTEARRDTFKQLMRPAYVRAGERAVEPYIGGVFPPIPGQAEITAAPDYLILNAQQQQQALQQLLAVGFHPVPANPYNALEMVAHLRRRPDEARSLIWTLNLELTPIYAVEPNGPYGSDAYKQLVDMLEGQSQVEGSQHYVERVSLPGILGDRSVRLFSGQVVPSLSMDSSRGMYAWMTTQQLDAAVRTIGLDPIARPPLGEGYLVLQVRQILRNILNKLYYQYRNLGVTSPDRALNFAATNIFQLARLVGAAILGGGPEGFAQLKHDLEKYKEPKDIKDIQTYLANNFKPRELSSIDVGRSPYCRMDSDCWDVQFKFFDPQNTNRALQVTRFTIDVSDKLPVTLGEVVNWSSMA